MCFLNGYVVISVYKILNTECISVHPTESSLCGALVEWHIVWIQSQAIFFFFLPTFPHPKAHLINSILLRLNISQMSTAAVCYSLTLIPAALALFLAWILPMMTPHPWHSLVIRDTKWRAAGGELVWKNNYTKAWTKRQKLIVAVGQISFKF